MATKKDAFCVFNHICKKKKLNVTGKYNLRHQMALDIQNYV